MLSHACHMCRVKTHTGFLRWHKCVHAQAVFTLSCVFTHVHACMTNLASQLAIYLPFSLSYDATVLVTRFFSLVAACMRIKYSYRKLHTFTFHAITCITCSSASRCLRDFRSSSGSFGSPVLVPCVELVQAETELSSLKTDVMMTA